MARIKFSRLNSPSLVGLIHFPKARPEFKLRAYSSSPLKWTKKRFISCSRFQPTLAVSLGINSQAGWEENELALLNTGKNRIQSPPPIGGFRGRER